MNLHSRTAWSDYFPGTSPTTPLSPNEYTSRKTVSNTYVYVLNCLFNQCSSTSDGGALYCSSVTYLLVESSSFLSCKTSTSNGAIFFQNTNSGECVLYKVCGINCCSTNTHYQFADIRVKDAASSKNYINYTSIVRCVNENSNSFSVLYLRYGKFCCPSVNMSMNKCARQTVISCSPFTDSNSVTCSLSYSSFTDNIATQYRCIYTNIGGAKYEMKCCNVLRNTQIGSDSGGIISLHGNMKIEDSCILENNANYIFYSFSSSYTFTLSNCTVDKTTSTGGFIMQNTVTKSFILALNHMSTQNCNAEYDSAGTLIPIIRTPSSCNTMICKCTCKILFYQSHLRDFISLICVFMFNFIHPYPSFCY
jgi:hypothetical protein